MWLDGKKVMVDIEDKVQWGETKNGNFIIKSMSRGLGGKSQYRALRLGEITYNHKLAAREANWGKKFSLGKVPKGCFL